MATTIPENVEQFTTEGEWQTYRFLEYEYAQRVSTRSSKPTKYFF
jgi:hypothetical protein